MTMQTHLKALLSRHSKLNKSIDKIETLAFVNETRVHELKKQRLRLKDEIEQVRTTLNHRPGRSSH